MTSRGTGSAGNINVVVYVSQNSGVGHPARAGQRWPGYGAVRPRLQLPPATQGRGADEPVSGGDIGAGRPRQVRDKIRALGARAREAAPQVEIAVRIERAANRREIPRQVFQGFGTTNRPPRNSPGRARRGP